MHQPGPPLFKIQGELCHYIGSLLPDDGQPHHFLQLYIADTGGDPVDSLIGRAVRRTQQMDLRQDTLRTLIQMMTAESPLAQVLQTAHERLRVTPHNLRISTIEPHNRDHRRYNRPRSSDVAALIPEGSSGVAHQRDIVIQFKGGQLQRVSHLHSAYLPLRYVLVLPRMTQGWNPSMNLGSLHGYLDQCGPRPAATERCGNVFASHTDTAQTETSHSDSGMRFIFIPAMVLRSHPCITRAGCSKNGWLMPMPLLISSKSTTTRHIRVTCVLTRIGTFGTQCRKATPLQTLECALYYPQAMLAAPNTWPSRIVIAWRSYGLVATPRSSSP